MFSFLNTNSYYMSMKREWVYDSKTFNRCLYVRRFNRSRRTEKGQTSTTVTLEKMYNNKLRTRPSKSSFKVPLIETRPKRLKLFLSLTGIRSPTNIIGE